MPGPRPLILHLLDAAGEGHEASPARLALLAQCLAATPQYQHRVLLFGPPWMQQLAAEVGLAAGVTRCDVPFHQPLFGLRLLRRQRNHATRPDLIHAWSSRAARLARVALRTTPLVQLTLPGPGLTPSVDPDRVDGSTRQALRSRWGLGERARLIALLSDGSGKASVMAGALAVGLARECLRDQHELVLGIHPRVRGLSLVFDMMSQVNWRGGLIQDAVFARPWHALPACDLALATNTQLTTEPLWAAAAHVPIIAERGAAVTDLLAERGGAVSVAPNTAREAGYQLVELIREPRKGAALTHAAAAALEATFTREATAASLAAHYDACLAQSAASP